MLELSRQTPPGQFIGRSDIECLRGGTGLLIRTVQCAASIPLRVTHGKCWPIGKQRTPTDRESLPRTYGRKIRTSDQAERPCAVACIVVARESRKSAARKEIHICINAAGICK